MAGGAEEVGGACAEAGQKRRHRASKEMSEYVRNRDQMDAVAGGEIGVACRGLGVRCREGLAWCG